MQLNLDEIRDVPFKYLKNFYNRKYYLCNKLGYSYNINDNKLKDVTCMRWFCSECRPIKKYIYFLEILKNCYAFDLNKHFVITFGGKEFRDRYSYEESYSIMSEKWNKYLQIIKYKYGYLNFILFNRSQKTGYCHYHVICDKSLDWNFLNEKRKDLGLGFVSIQKNKDVVEYLGIDYWKDQEYIIPYGYKHIRTSRSIKLNNNLKPEIKRYDYDMDIDKILLDIKQNYNKIIDIDQYCIDKLIKNVKKNASILND